MGQERKNRWWLLPVVGAVMVTLESGTTRHDYRGGAFVRIRPAPAGEILQYPCCASEDDCGAVVCQSHGIKPLEDTLDFNVAHCEEKDTEGNECEPFLEPIVEARTNKTAICAPTFFGGYLEARMRYFLTDWFDHNRKIGIDRFYIYSENDPPSWKREEVRRRNSDITWVKMAFSTEKTMYHGQIFALNDCLKRALTDGYERVLNADTDEFLHFLRDETTIDSYLDRERYELLETFDQKSLDPEIVTFGGLDVEWDDRSEMRPCESTTLRTCLHPPPDLKNVTCIASYTDPSKTIPYATDRCPRWHGHRKHVTFTRRVLAMDVHAPPWQTNGCLRKWPHKKKCDVYHESTKLAWVRHFRGGTPLTTDKCPRCIL